jgi:hypothetical protein
MPWEPIAKSSRNRKVVPNLPDYEQARAAFSWDQARRELDGLPGGQGLNIHMDEWEVFPREAVATAMKAQEQGIARLSKSQQQLHDHAAKVMRHGREATQLLMREGYIPQAP